MAKLNITADQIQSTTNMIPYNASAADWASDSKYPSANAVVTKITEMTSGVASGVEYPIGSVIMTHKELAANEDFTAANPATLLGIGLPDDWELIDKEFINRSANITPLWTSSRATASGYISWADHAVCLKMWLITDAYPLSPGDGIGSIDRTKAGVASFSMSDEGGVAFAVTGTTNTVNYVIKYKLDGGGSLSLEEIYGENVAAFSGATIHIQTIIPITMGNMLDTACDKFYWKRRA